MLFRSNELSEDLPLSDSSGAYTSIFIKDPEELINKRSAILKRQKNIYASIDSYSVCFPKKRKKEIQHMIKLYQEFSRLMSENIKITEDQIRNYILQTREGKK